MAQAAYCSQCKANVYVTDDGRCPNGHGPESLSDFYEVSDAEAPPTSQSPGSAPEAATPDYAAPTPAEAAISEATSPTRKSKLPWIIGMVVLLLVLCGVVTCVGAGALLNSATDELSSTIDESVSQVEEEMDAATGKSLTTESDTVTEETEDIPAEDIQTMIEHFYPGFTLEGYYLVTVADGPEDASTYHVIAAYDNVPAFRITFFIYRSETENPAGSDVEGQAFLDDTTGAWWIHPQTRDHGLDSVFGPQALIGAGATLDQVATDFTAAHPTKIVSDVSDMTNVDLGFQGIDDSELDDWYDDSESFESTWKLDMQVSPGVWREIDFTEF